MAKRGARRSYWLVNLGEQRAKAAIPYQALCDLTGIKLPTMRSWEKGETGTLKALNVIKLAIILQTNPDYLLGNTIDSSPMSIPKQRNEILRARKLTDVYALDDNEMKREIDWADPYVEGTVTKPYTNNPYTRDW